MILPEFPLLEYDHQYKQEMRPDGPCWWSIEQIEERTAPYCVPVYRVDVFGTLTYDGLYVSEEVFDSICERIQCQN